MAERPALNILHLASGDLWAGAEMQLYTLARALHRRNDTHVTVILLNPGELERKLRDAGVAVSVLDETRLPAHRLLWTLIRTVRTLQPDVIHTHRFKENVLGGMAAWLNGRIPSLRTTHGAPEHRVAWWRLPASLVALSDWAVGRYLQARNIAVSAELAELLRTRFPPERIDVVPNGIDVEETLRLGQGECPFAQAPPPTLHVGIAGRLMPVKRLDLFIRIAEDILRQRGRQQWCFHIIGDGPLRGELEAQCAALGVGDNVRFEGHRTDIYRWLRHLDLLVMCSDHEGLPMIVLEAMALGTPVVAHAVGGIGAVLEGGASGVLVKTHHVEAYVKEILALADDPGRREALREAAARRVSQTYSATRNADALMTIYRTLVGRESAA